MGKKEEIKGKVSQLFNLPQEVVLNLPKISIVGNLKVSIENHRGIIKYTGELVKIRGYKGQIIVKGYQLVIESMEEDQILIKGKIVQVSFNLF